MGLRAVAKHNALLRLATVRHAMVGYIRRAPAGFGVCVAAHFYYKRAELGRQMAVWLAEAADMAAYEMELMRNAQRAREAYEAAAAATDPAPAPAAPKGGKGAGGGYHPAYDPYYHGGSASTGPTDFPLAAKQYSASTKALYTAYTHAYAPLAKWQSDTSVSGHQPFAYGLGAIPPRPTGADAAVDAGVAGAELFARALAKWEAHVVPGAAPVAVSNAVASGGSSSSSSSAAAAGGALAPAPGHPYFVAAMYARLGPRYTELAVPGGPLGPPKPGSAAAQQAAYYGGGGGGGATQKMADLALATAEAADQLLAELARMAPPKLSSGEGDDE